ncbi:hypothetical protein Tco_0508099 [Tanacetum coccineum]
MEAIQADCDIKATNIILQGLPPEVYALVSNHKVAKELCEKNQLLLQGTSLMKQEKEYRIHMNLLDRVLQLYQPFLLPERLKADNTDFHLHCEYLSITRIFWKDLKDNA